LDAAAGFVIAAATIAAIVHALALAQLSTVAVLRPIGWALAGLGVIALVRHGAQIGRRVHQEALRLWNVGAFERTGAILAVIIVVGLAAAALGPPTDADSMDYHLGVPLDWLRHGGAYPRADWFHSRLLGIAESLNLLGLGAGVDNLGACMQFGGLIGAAIALRAFASTSADRLLAWLLVAACPTVAFLVPNQKPMMLPAAATTIAIALAVRRFHDFRLGDAVLAFGCVAFAAASKISFLLSVGFVVAICLAAAWKSGRLLAHAAVAAAAFAVFLLPVLLRSYVFFGDPISPFLERFRHPADPAVVDFAFYLRTASGEPTADNLLMLPLRILGTLHPGGFTTVLGVGALAFIPALRVKGPLRLLLAAALASTIASVCLGQLAARFFLEPYLWAGAALVAAGRSWTKDLLRGALVLQSGVAAVVALVGAGTLFPGALTAARRSGVMERSAAGYAQGEWLDKVLPADAVLIEQGRYHAFSPRPFAVATPTSIGSGPDADKALAMLVGDFGANSIVVLHSNVDDAFSRLSRRCGEPLAPPRVFTGGTRNPFNAQTYEVQAFRLRGCDLVVDYLKGGRPQPR
jgi:hypothetical protein